VHRRVRLDYDTVDELARDERTYGDEPEDAPGEGPDATASAS
jgi:hypothetical protein